MPATPACNKSAVCEAASVVTQEKFAMEPARDSLAVILHDTARLDKIASGDLAVDSEADNVPCNF